MPHLQRLGQHKPGLGHGALRRIHQQQHPVHHVQHTLHLAAEIRMAGGVDDVDLDAVVAYGGVLRQNGDAPLTLQVVAVHDTLRYILILPECAALLEHFVHQGGFAVVTVGDDGDIPQIVSYHNGHPFLLRSSDTPQYLYTFFVEYVQISFSFGHKKSLALCKAIT